MRPAPSESQNNFRNHGSTVSLQNNQVLFQFCLKLSSRPVEKLPKISVEGSALQLRIPEVPG